MKKLFSLFFAVVCTIVFVPALIIFVFDFGGSSDKNHTDDVTVYVKVAGEVKEFELEKYLYGVLAAEMPASFHEEALKAQAVAARTYIINKKQSGDNDHPDADVCTDSTHCKAYLSDEEIDGKFGSDWQKQYGSKVKAVVEGTRREIIVYGGEPIEAVFHSSGSGFTENASDVWGNEVPYLVSVESPGDMLSPTFANDVKVSFQSFCSKVSEYGGGEASPYIGEILRNESGSVKKIDLGGSFFEGVKVREMFSLPSANFTVSLGDGEFIFHCKGKGHGVGMSQYGAEYFANQGMDYKEILKKYYTGIEVVNIEETNDKNS